MISFTFGRSVQPLISHMLKKLFCCLACFVILSVFSLSFVQEKAAGGNASPLYVEFVDTYNVLNDGKTLNTLTLRIKNISGKQLKLQSEESKATKLNIKFDTQDDGEYKPTALGTTNQVASIVVELEDPNESTYWTIKKHTQTIVPYWSLSPQSDLTLNVGDSILVELSSIMTDLPSGPTNLQVDYENIDNYDKGTLFAIIEKGPVVYKNVEVEEEEEIRVGIGTAEPEAKLHVAGDAKVNGTVTASAFKGDGMVPEGVIVMWSGDVNKIPQCWALCNGSNGTPNLQDRFIVGAKMLVDVDAPQPNSNGDADQHDHLLSIPEITATTGEAGKHTHLFPKNWNVHKNYIGKGGGKWGIDPASGKDQWNMSEAEEHSHSVTIQQQDIRSTLYTGPNRPKWYALCFIMKVKCPVDSAN